MPYYECFPTRQEAVHREAELKRKKSAESLRRLIESPEDRGLFIWGRKRYA
jgi:predicted GIY-YIG superfamily endonuclease